MKTTPLLLLTTLLYVYANVALAGGLPFFPQPADVLQDNQVPPTGYTRLKISLSNGNLGSEKQVRVSNVSVCSDTACYQSVVPAYIDLFDTRDGKAQSLIQMAVPYMEVKSVHFESSPSPRSIQGDIELTAPLKLAPEFKGGEILVVVKKTIAKQAESYYPSSTASNFLPSTTEGDTVYYNPSFSTFANLKFDATISIPSGAARLPQIFIIAIHDTGDQFPLIDIYPVIKLSRGASISLKESVRESDQDQVSPSSNSISPKTNRASKTRTIWETGVIRGALEALPDAQSISLNAVPSAATAASTATCLSYFSLPENQQAITANLATTGTVYLNWCETIPPYVHITVSNLKDSRELFALQFEWYNGNDPRNSLKLLRLPNLSWPVFQVLINGFYWTGDSGITDGGKGLANGFVQSLTGVLGNNAAGGGRGSAPWEGNKLALLQAKGSAPDWKEGSVPPLFNYAPASFAIVSSSTSILKSGVCATDSLVSRWSAVGTTPSARMILMSSTSGSSTSAAELCPLYQALGANYAIRLDGGPSAGMMIDRVLKNPLTGLDFVRYGSSRHIAYALGVMRTDGTVRTPAPTTPAPVAVPNGHVPPPTDPCKINPASCS